MSANAPGLAFNAGCDGGACRAGCTLDGAHYVGCIADSPVASYCYASCGACP